MKSELAEKNILFLNQNRNILDLDPFFQRGRIWGESRKQLFIDTLLKGWGVPKIYLAAYKNAQNKIHKYECIDGKQRLTAVFDFFDDKLKIKLNGREYLYKDLDLDIKEELGKYLFDIEIVEDFNADELADLFQRLQSGQVLNSSEKLKATPGEMSKFIFDLSNQNIFREKIISKSKRHPHLATVAQSVMLCLKNDIVSVKYTDLSRFLKEYRSFNKKGEEAKKVLRILKYINENFNKENAGIVFTNRAMFVSCFYLISYLMTRGDISKIKIKDFFINFVKNLSKANRGIGTARITKDLIKLKDFQNAVIQGADSATALRIRHQILLDTLVLFDEDVADIVNHETSYEKFIKLYKKKLKRYNGKHWKLNDALIQRGCKTKTGPEKEESLPAYIRHENEHPGARQYTKNDLEYAISYLEKFR